jgi:hypothetical protein
MTSADRRLPPLVLGPGHWLAVDEVPVGCQHGIETGFSGDLEQVVAGHDAGRGPDRGFG